MKNYLFFDTDLLSALAFSSSAVACTVDASRFLFKALSFLPEKNNIL